MASRVMGWHLRIDDQFWWRRKKSVLRRYAGFSGPWPTRCRPSPV